MMIDDDRTSLRSDGVLDGARPAEIRSVQKYHAVMFGYLVVREREGMFQDLVGSMQEVQDGGNRAADSDSGRDSKTSQAPFQDKGGADPVTIWRNVGREQRESGCPQCAGDGFQVGLLGRVVTRHGTSGDSRGPCGVPVFKAPAAFSAVSDDNMLRYSPWVSHGEIAAIRHASRAHDRSPEDSS